MRIEEDHQPIEVPTSYLNKWQSVVDTLARLVGVPAGLIMRLNASDIEVYVSSETEGNPYEAGQKESVWGSGLYCEEVIKSRDRLLIPNALSEDRWKDSWAKGAGINLDCGNRGEPFQGCVIHI